MEIRKKALKEANLTEEEAETKNKGNWLLWLALEIVFKLVKALEKRLSNKK